MADPRNGGPESFYTVNSDGYGVFILGEATGVATLSSGGGAHN